MPRDIFFRVDLLSFLCSAYRALFRLPRNESSSYYRGALDALSTVAIPMQVKSDKPEATFENGVLTLTIPKIEEIKPKQIGVKAKGAIEGKK